MREKKRKWTWDYFAERRDDRNKYVDLFQRKQLGALPLVVSMRHLSFHFETLFISIYRTRKIWTVWKENFRMKTFDFIGLSLALDSARIQHCGKDWKRRKPSNSQRSRAGAVGCGVLLKKPSKKTPHLAGR